MIMLCVLLYFVPSFVDDLFNSDGVTINTQHRVPVADARAGPRLMAAMEVDTVLALLECPVCLLPPRAPPIYQCRTGDAAPPRPPELGLV